MRPLRRTPPRRNGPAPTTPAGIERAARAGAARARRVVRLYVRANRCRFLWTLTTADSVRTWREIGRRWDAFAKALRESKGRFPIVAVFEPHPGGHGMHVHFATDRFVSVELIRKLWGHGIVHIGDPGKMPGRVPVRKLASYLAKYVAKTFAPESSIEGADELGALASSGQAVSGRRRGEHRYRVSQGFEPVRVSRYFATADEGFAWLMEHLGAPIESRPICLLWEGSIDGWWFEFPDRAQAPPPITRQK